MAPDEYEPARLDGVGRVESGKVVGEAVAVAFGFEDAVGARARLDGSGRTQAAMRAVELGFIEQED